MSTSPQEPAPPKPSHRTKEERRELVRTLVGLAVIVVAIVFALVNLDSVKVDWIVSSSKAPLIIVIAISAIAGFVLGWMGQRGRGRGRR